jgi:hypothetical protein
MDIDQRMKTIWMLMAEFNTSQIPLEDVAEKYLRLSPAKANASANLHQLPFPVYRVGTEKSQWLVSAIDLAAYIDKHREAAKTLVQNDARTETEHDVWWVTSERFTERVGWSKGQLRGKVERGILQQGVHWAVIDGARMYNIKTIQEWLDAEASAQRLPPPEFEPVRPKRIRRVPSNRMRLGKTMN